MATITVTEKIPTEATFDINSGVVVTRMFQATADSNLRPIQVKFADGIPQEGEEYPYTVGKLPRKPVCVRVRMQLEKDTDDLKTWLVVCEYDNSQQPYKYGRTKPWLEPPVIRFSHIPDETTLTHCYAIGNSTDIPLSGQLAAGDTSSPQHEILNVVHKEYDPGITVAKKLLQITVIQNVNPRKFSHKTHLSRINTCNLYQVHLAGELHQAYSLYMADMQADPKVDSFGQKYWQVTYTIIYNPEGWQVRKLQAGFETYEPDQTGINRWKSIRKNGVLIQSPANLNKEGQLLADGADPFYLDYAPYRPRSWKSLDLPKSLVI